MIGDVIPSPTLPKAPSRPTGGPSITPRKPPSDPTSVKTTPSLEAVPESEATDSTSDPTPKSRKHLPSDTESKQPLQRRPPAPKRPEDQPPSVKAPGPAPPRPPQAKKIPPPHPVSRPAKQLSVKVLVSTDMSCNNITLAVLGDVMICFMFAVIYRRRWKS